MNEILLEISCLPDVLAWKNTTGTARAIDNPARFIAFGLPGSADILGAVGPHGRMIALEVKSGNARQSPQQRNFERAVARVGGAYGVARSVADAVAFVKTAAASGRE